MTPLRIYTPEHRMEMNARRAASMKKKIEERKLAGDPIHMIEFKVIKEDREKVAKGMKGVWYA